MLAGTNGDDVRNICNLLGVHVKTPTGRSPSVYWLLWIVGPVLWVLWALIFLGLCRGDVVDLFALRSRRRLSAFVFVSIRPPCEL